MVTLTGFQTVRITTQKPVMVTVEMMLFVVKVTAEFRLP